MLFLNYLALYLVLNTYVLYGSDIDCLTNEFVNYFVTFSFNLSFMIGEFILTIFFLLLVGL